MTPGSNMAEKDGPRAATPLLLLLAVGFAVPLIAVTAFSFMPPRTFSLLQAPTLENYYTIFTGTCYISFLWSVVLAVLPSSCSRSSATRSPMASCTCSAAGRPPDAALHHPALRLGEHPPLWLGVVLHQERSTSRQHEIAFRHRAREQPVYARRHPSRYGLRLPAVHAVSHDAQRRHGAKRYARSGLDLGASRWQVFREVELPLSMPGILIGCLLTFVLAVGAIAEAKILGGRRSSRSRMTSRSPSPMRRTGRSEPRSPCC